VPYKIRKREARKSGCLELVREDPGKVSIVTPRVVGMRLADEVRRFAIDFGFLRVPGVHPVYEKPEDGRVVL
jgi:hypothetical protein